MACTQQRRAGVVVQLDKLRAPPDEHGLGGGEHDPDHGAQAQRPVRRWPYSVADQSIARVSRANSPLVGVLTLKGISAALASPQRGAWRSRGLRGKPRASVECERPAILHGHGPRGCPRPCWLRAPHGPMGPQRPVTP